MKKLIISFVLVQCIFLLNGFSHQCTNAEQGYSYSASALKDSDKTIKSNTEDIKSIFSSSKTTFKLEIAEIEDDKFLAFMGYIKRIHLYSVLFADQTPGHFFGYINKSEPITKSYSELSPNISFVTFQVFRI